MLGGQSSYGSPVIVPAPGGNWGVGLGTQSGGVGSSADNITTIAEVGTTTANGYGRAHLTRDQTGTGWPASSLISGAYQTTAPQVSFAFTGAPSPNGATLIFLAGATTINQDNAIMAFNTASTRVFNGGDSELATVTARIQ